MTRICRKGAGRDAMTYEHIKKGIFQARPNRFVAQVMIDGKEHRVHVKNTGRCRELLIPGAAVVLEDHPDAEAKGRKTRYSLVAVYKGDLLINMDSQAPNEAAAEWLAGGGFYEATGRKPEQIRREVTWGQSRFDLSFIAQGHPSFLEVKGVTLEEKGIAMFPDAPTERGVKHLHELARAATEGFDAYVLFVIQMKGIDLFTPNVKMHREFALALCQAEAAGVHILAYDCLVREDGFSIHRPVPVKLPKPL